MLWIVFWVVSLCAGVCGFGSVANADDHCKGWEQKNLKKAICIRFPQGPMPAKRFPLVVFAPGCEGFDGQGYPSPFGLDKRRIPDVQKGFSDYYEQKSDLLLKAGFAVAKIDFTRKSLVQKRWLGGFDCKLVWPTVEVVKDIATITEDGIVWLKRTYRDQIDTADVRLIASSLGGEGVLMMLKLWGTLDAADRPKRIVTLYPFCTTEVGGWQSHPRHLFIYGAIDGTPRASTQNKFISLATVCKLQAQSSSSMDVNVFPDAGHAFDMPISGGAVRARRGNYEYGEYIPNAAAAGRAWQLILEFLK